MTGIELNKIFTDKVIEYINKGYLINPNSFKGSDGTARVDLVKEDSFIRVYFRIENDYDEYYDYIIVLTVGEKKLDKYQRKVIADKDLIWTSDLTTIEEQKMIKLYSKNTFYVTEKEYNNMRDKIKTRFKNKSGYYGYEQINLNDKAIDIVFPYIKRQPRCKSIKKKDITRVFKAIRERKKVEYIIVAKGNTYRIK